jgi:hypothetical protein
MVEWFKNELAPRLTDVRPVDIQQATGLSASFVLFVRNGKRVPHPRWHRALADLTGVEYPFRITTAKTKKDDHLHSQAIGTGGAVGSGGDVLVNQLTFQPSKTF